MISPPERATAPPGDRGTATRIDLLAREDQLSTYTNQSGARNAQAAGPAWTPIGDALAAALHSIFSGRSAPQ